jgi:hypothetical protein
VVRARRRAHRAARPGSIPAAPGVALDAGTGGPRRLGRVGGQGGDERIEQRPHVSVAVGAVGVGIDGDPAGRSAQRVAAVQVAVHQDVGRAGARRSSSSPWASGPRASRQPAAAVARGRDPGGRGPRRGARPPGARGSPGARAARGGWRRGGCRGPPAHEQGEALVPAIQQRRDPAGRRPGREGVALGAQLGLLGMSARVDLGHHGDAVPARGGHERDVAAGEAVQVPEPPRRGRPGPASRRTTSAAIASRPAPGQYDAQCCARDPAAAVTSASPGCIGGSCREDAQRRRAGEVGVRRGGRQGGEGRQRRGEGEGGADRAVAHGALLRCGEGIGRPSR